MHGTMWKGHFLVELQLLGHAVRNYVAIISPSLTWNIWFCRKFLIEAVWCPAVRPNRAVWRNTVPRYTLHYTTCWKKVQFVSLL